MHLRTLSLIVTLPLLQACGDNGTKHDADADLAQPAIGDMAMMLPVDGNDGAVAEGDAAMPGDMAMNIVPGTFQAVTSFGSNPGSLKMYEYVPGTPAASAPLIVVLHGCGMDAESYALASGWNTLADHKGFYVVYAEQQTANNSAGCFNWFDSTEADRDSGEAMSMKQMIDKMMALHTIDATRVFVTGLSAGGAMTSQLLADYPEVFAAGAVMSGIPAGCASTFFGASSCLSGTSHSASYWAGQAEDLNPGYSGARPRVVIFHGSADGTVDPANLGELVKQWTEVLGADQTADSSQTMSGYTVKGYKNGGGQEVVRSYLFDGMDHGIAVNPGTGPGQGGMTGPYSFAEALWSTLAAAEFFGL